MMVTGGSGSGKSEFAESLVTGLADGPNPVSYTHLLCKPLRGLGWLEEVVVQIAGIYGDAHPHPDKRAVVIMGADNGVVKEGVTQTDSSVKMCIRDRAQAMQAEACGIDPTADMNPILLKPTSNVGSQVIVNGEVRGNMKAMDYYKNKKQLIPDVLTAYERLSNEYDIIVIEGAGSPAEINLHENDIVNMGMAKMAKAPVLLVGDIDRGGVFAALYGTVKLLPEDEQAMIKGLVVNKFRGDVKILEPGLRMIEEKTDIPVVGVVPMERLDIDDEDLSLIHISSESA